MDTITNTEDLRAWMGNEPDSLNIFLPVSAAAFDVEENEVVYLSKARQFQIEGFVLQPRRLRAIPVEIITRDPDEARYILGIVKASQAQLAERQATAVLFASQLFRAPSSVREPMREWERINQLGGMLDTEPTTTES